MKTQQTDEEVLMTLAEDEGFVWDVYDFGELELYTYVSQIGYGWTPEETLDFILEHRSIGDFADSTMDGGTTGMTEEMAAELLYGSDVPDLTALLM